MIFIIALQVFLTSFLLNLFWELVHSQLYETCLKLPLKKFIPVIIKVSLSDGLWITLFFTLSVFIFRNTNILNNNYQILFFIIVSLISAFVWEKIALRLKRWEYAETMPKLFGVGITPLLQLAVTGILTFIFIFLL